MVPGAVQVGPFTFEIVSQDRGEVELRVLIAADAVQAVFDEVLRQATERANLEPAARTAVPTRDEVMAAHGEGIRDSLRDSLVDWALAVARDTLRLSWVDTPVTRLATPKAGRAAVLTARLFVVPEVELEALTGLNLPSRRPVLAEADVARATALLPRALRRAREASAGRVQPGAAVHLRVAGRGATPSDAWVDVLLTAGSVDAPEGLAAAAAALLGTTVGDRLDTEVHDGGVAVPLAVEVVGVGSLEPPLDASAVAARLGLQASSDLPGAVRGALEEALAERFDAAVLGQVLAHVATRVRLAVPEVLVRRRFARRALLEQGAGLVGPEDPEAAFETAKGGMSEEVRHGLLLAGLMELAGISVTDDEHAATIRARHRLWGVRTEVTDKTLRDTVWVTRSRQAMVVRRLVEWLMERRSASGAGAGEA